MTWQEKGVAIKKIFEEAIRRTKSFEIRAKQKDVLVKVDALLRELESGRLDREIAFFALVGLADVYMVPLTPGDLEDLRELLCAAKTT
ncbi:MAG: hypothetical protein QXU97_02610 [Fervidicoccaceae archaeon]